jgi:hypothetical protein
LCILHCRLVALLTRISYRDIGCERLRIEKRASLWGQIGCRLAAGTSLLDEEANSDTDEDAKHPYDNDTRSQHASGFHHKLITAV